MALYAFDGTWNKEDTDSDELDENTNVYNFLRFYAPGDPETREKLGEYAAGVGTRFGRAGRIVGGFFGAGGRDRVREMVDSFRSNWSRNKTEDRTVDVIGFSRGAALALHFCNKLAKGVKLDGGETVKPEIRFLGLWDTVPSFGLPGVLLRETNDINIGWDLDVPKSVQNCFHAMALDERRGAFNVHRLDPEHDDAPRIQEWWFRGVHSDVGGGNGNVERNNLALVWMLQQAHACGLPIALDEAAKLKSNLAAPVLHGKQPGRSGDRTILKGRQNSSQCRAQAEHRRNGRGRSRFEAVVRLQRDPCRTGRSVSLQTLSRRKVEGQNHRVRRERWPPDLNRGRTVLGWLKAKKLQSHALGLTKRVPEANWFEMVACVGATAKGAVPVGAGQFAQTAWRAPHSGPLHFFANDARLSGFGRDFYDNNEGEINVTVERVS
jgi:hypothetical protein